MKLQQQSLLLFTFLIILPFKSIATSCSPRMDTIIAECNGSICEKIIYISEVKTFGSYCARRPKHIETPIWAQSLIESELKLNGHANESSVFELEIFKSYFVYLNQFKDIQDVKTAIEKQSTEKNYYRKLKKIENTSFESHSKHWKSIENNVFIDKIIRKLVEIISLVIPIILLSLSTVWFIQWCKGIKSLKWLLLCLAIQIAIMSLFVMTYLGFGFIYYKYLIFGMIIPGIWFFQIVIIMSNVLNDKKPKIN